MQDDIRTRKIKRNVLAMIGIKGLSLLISLAYVPLLLHSLNSVNYGIWLTLTSIVGWVAMFDVGLGHGLRNRLSEALACGNVYLGKQYVSTAYVGICLAIIFFLLIFLFVSNCFLSWNNILKVPTSSDSELTLLVHIVFVSFGANFVLGLINSILYALQLPAFSTLLTLLGQLFSFLFVYILTSFFKITSLLILGTTISIVPVIVLFVATIIVFSREKYKNLAPSIRCFQISKLRDILSLGIKFFIIQIITLVLYQTNNLLILHIIGNEAVVEYNIAFKYMNMLVMGYTIIVTPLWSATTEAYTKGDLQWIMQAVRKLQRISLIIIIVGGIMLLLSNYIYRIWIGVNAIDIKFSTTFMLYIYLIFKVLYSNYGYILNGIGKLNLQIVMTAILAVTYIPLVYILGTWFGLTGVLIIFAFNSFVNFLWSKFQYKKLIAGTATGIWNS